VAASGNGVVSLLGKNMFASREADFVGFRTSVASTSRLPLMFIDLIARRFIPSIPRPVLHVLGILPKPITQAERMRQFPKDGLPTEQPVTLRWNSYHVPYIEAKTDRDLAVAVGLVHAHLRGTQMSLMRLVSQGRLAEILGAPARKVDHALRVLDLCQATAEIEKRLPDDTRTWLDGFVSGINHYQSLGHPRPHEMRWLGLKTEPWTVRDVIGVGRLVGADFNWLILLMLLKHRSSPAFKSIWEGLLEVGGGFEIAAETDDPAMGLARELVGIAKAGSNAVAVGPERSASGRALLACDPHLGLAMPNIWLLMGLRSPSYNCVGFMLSGLPFVCIGRNPDLAWGGTNLRSASSDLFDLSALEEDEIETRSVTVKTRFGRTVKRRVRRTPHGTLLADAALFGLDKNDRTALRWIGHEPTDEISAFLRASRAGNGKAFCEAFRGYGVPGQTMIYADREGAVGKVLAATLPRRGDYHGDEFVKDIKDAAHAWRNLVDLAHEAPRTPPKDGLLVSANDPVTDAPAPVGFLFDYGDRMRRLREILEAERECTPETLVRALRDTFSGRAHRLAQRFGRDIQGFDLSKDAQDVAITLLDWDGCYGTESEGALVFELVLTELLPIILNTHDSKLWRETLAQWNFVAGYLESKIDALPAEKWRPLLERAALSVARRRGDHRVWGDMHRVQIAHVLAKLPLIGQAFVQGDMPSPGSRQTLYKTAHGPVTERHVSDFGTMACFSSDLADEDANEFVLFGGQDEWMGSPSFADQVPLWQSGRSIRMPLRQEVIAESFPDVMTLTPKNRETA
jgi:penicillin amidase